MNAQNGKWILSELRPRLKGRTIAGCGCGWLADERTKRSIASKRSSAAVRESSILRKCSYTNLPYDGARLAHVTTITFVC
jgi:hypothetical protein